MPTPPMPGWNEPVATGIRSPIFSVAFWPSTARMLGFWISFESASLNRIFAVAEGIFSSKFVALICARLLRLTLPMLPVVVVLPVVFVVGEFVGVLLVVEFRLSCSVAETLAGGWIPRFRIFVFETCI